MSAPAAFTELAECSVRFLIVGGLGGGTMEKVYCDAAMTVRNDELFAAKPGRRLGKYSTGRGTCSIALNRKSYSASAEN